MTTPNELAAELRISPKALRQFLRARFTRPAAEWHTDWEVTLPMIVAAVRRFG
jgi:hypothetical protein